MTLHDSYPVSVTAMNASIADELENSSFKYMQSHQNDPMGAAITLEVIRTIIDEDLICAARQKGHWFLKELESLKDGVRILAVRGKGLMFRIDPPLSITKEAFSRFVEDFRNILQKQEG